MKSILTLALAVIGFGAFAQSSIQDYAPQSTVRFATYTTRAAGQTNPYTGKYSIAFRDTVYTGVWRDVFAVTMQTNSFYFGYDTNNLRITGAYPTLGNAASGQYFAGIVTGTSNLLAATALTSTTGFTNTFGQDVQVRWYHTTGTVGAGVYSNVNVNGSLFENSTNDSGSVILQPNEYIQWGGGAGFTGTATGVKGVWKPL